jgi:two-component system, LuxR family, sensor kinase FixL
VEDERERLGRDLHDDLSQRLAGIAIMMGSIGKQLLPRGTGGKLRDIGNLLNEAVATARNISRGLHPVTLGTHGLPAALAELAERVPAEVEFKWPQSARLDIDRAVALHVYRIAEEAVGNAIRHSESQKIRIELRTNAARTVSLSISDDGKGLEARGASGGMGFQNMRYRAAAIGGALEITTAMGGGTAVICSFPLSRLGSAKRGASSRAKASNRKSPTPRLRRKSR